jgi:alpha-D-ribose 1-methylphosphonate 5-triphosphate synthase subunit PhnL
VAANIALFDFDAAEQSDRSNSGRYTIDSGRLIIRMQDQLPDIVTEPPRDGVLKINSVTYQRQ